MKERLVLMSKRGIAALLLLVWPVFVTAALWADNWKFIWSEFRGYVNFVRTGKM